MEKLDCGHFPTKTESNISNGIARDRDTGKTMCYDCASKPDIEAVERGEELYAYVSGDGKLIVTWPGIELMKVTYNGTARTGFYGSSISYIRAVAPNGKHYYGKNGGNGMWIKMKPNKK